MISRSVSCIMPQKSGQVRASTESHVNIYVEHRGFAMDLCYCLKKLRCLHFDLL